MNSRERVRLALNHQEPDHVPLDIAGTGVSQIHATAYRNLRQFLGLPAPEPNIIFVAEQLAKFETDIAQRLDTDFVFVLPQAPATFLWQDRVPNSHQMSSSCNRRRLSSSDVVNHTHRLPTCVCGREKPGSGWTM